MTSDYPLYSSLMKNSYDFSNSTMLAETNDDMSFYSKVPFDNSVFDNSKLMKTIENTIETQVDTSLNDDNLLYSIAELDDLFSSTNNNEKQLYVNDVNDAFNIDSFTFSLFENETTDGDLKDTSLDVEMLNFDESADVTEELADNSSTIVDNGINGDFDRLIGLMGLSSSAINCLTSYNKKIQISSKTSVAADSNLSKPKVVFSPPLVVDQPSPDVIDSRLPYIYVPKMDSTNDNYSHPLSKSFHYKECLNTVELKRKNIKAHRQRSIQAWLEKRKRRNYRNSSAVVYQGLSAAACKKQRSKGKFVKETHWISISQ